MAKNVSILSILELATAQIYGVDVLLLKICMYPMTKNKTIFLR